MKESNKNLIIIGIIVIMVVTVICSIISNSKNKEVKKFNIESISNLVINGYDNVREMDFIDMTTLFGVEFESDNKDMLFLTNSSNLDTLTTDTMILVVMNLEEIGDNYAIFQSFLDSKKRNIDEKELLDYLDTAILKEGDGFVYLILAQDPTMLEREIYSFYY